MSEQSADIQGQELKARLENRDIRGVKQFFRTHEIADISETLAYMPLSEALPFFRLLPRSRRAKVFAYLPLERQEELLAELPQVITTAIVNEMEPDDRTKMLEELPFEIRNKLLLNLSPEERRIAWQLLSYPEDSVGRLMTTEIMELNASARVNDVMERLRWAREIPQEQLNVLYVTDANRQYIGDVTLAGLVTADPPTKKIEELMTGKQAAIKATDDQSVAVDFFRKYDRSYLPVVDEDNILLGIVTADDVFDVAEEEATEDIQQFGGQSTLEDSYFQTPLLTLFRKRAGWLGILFAGGTITAATLRHYEGYAVSMAWLVFFLPLIVSAGGNTGSQTASLVIRGLAVKEMELRDWFRVLWREFVVALGLGVVLASLGYARAVTWDLTPLVGAVVAASLLGVVLFGAIVGGLLPFLFKRLNLDPAVSSSPLLAQLVDIIGAVIFYNTAYHLVTYWQGR
jgi:magnesium transporter